MSTELLEVVTMPTVEELQRIVDAWFDASPIQNAYACIRGDDEANAETGDYSELPVEEQNRILSTAVGILWLRAARKRLTKP